jgi:hypothetical protein
MLAKQALYHMSHKMNWRVHFALVILEMGFHELFAQDGLEP